MKNKILIFGGTTEGRSLAKILDDANIPHTVSVASRYGEEIEQQFGERNLTVGRKNASEIADFITEGGFEIIVDATHPFATKVSSEIIKACKMTNVNYYRLSRDTASDFALDENIIYVNDLDEAVSYLSKITGTVLVLTGSKELKTITEGLSYRKDIYARVLPNEESIQKCKEAGLLGKQIIAMQGPFSKNMNVALINEIHAKVILTKESGKAGGLNEKLQAAAECKIKAVVIRNPENACGLNNGKSLEEILKIIEELTGKIIEKKQKIKRITLAGMGPGGSEFFTDSFKKAYQSADIIFGANSVLKAFLKESSASAKTVSFYLAEDILDFLSVHPEYENPLVIYSGDISLCSGAKRATEIFAKNGIIVERIPGISSVSLFAQRLRLDLEKCEIVSSHGKNINVTGYALKNEKLIVLTSGFEHAMEIANKLPDYMHIVLGHELGGSDERIIDLEKENFIEENLNGRILLYIENPKACDNLAMHISDDDFIRGDVPMTKEEIRAFSIRMLELTKSSVLYDIGAGTGSVSVEAALIHPDIKVFAIEKKKEAALLIKKNRQKFHADNIEIIEKAAPDAMEGLPVPTHVFIGGSSGNLKQIIQKAKEKNDKVKIVINCLTLQTLSEATCVLGEYENAAIRITQLSATRYKKVGSYDLPDSQNPVYIIRLS